MNKAKGSLHQNSLVLQIWLQRQTFDDLGLNTNKHVVIMTHYKVNQHFDVGTFLGHYMWVRKLHSIGLDLDTRCEQDEFTPLLDLLRAPLADSFESLWRFDSTLSSILVLLTCGANPCARTERGRNALHVVNLSACNIRRALKDANVFNSEAEHKILTFFLNA